MIAILNLKTVKTVPAGAVLVDRTTPFGNPYQVGIDGDREEVIARFEGDFAWKIEHDAIFKRQVDALGRPPALLCHCAPMRCHAEVIAKYLEGREARCGQ